MLTIFLTICMIFTMLPVGALAVETPPEPASIGEINALNGYPVQGGFLCEKDRNRWKMGTVLLVRFCDTPVLGWIEAGEGGRSFAHICGG